MFNNYKEAIEKRDNQSVIPLGVAAGFSTLEVFKFLYDAYPEGVHGSRFSLLSYALCNNLKNMETIKYIMTTFPEQVKVVDNRGAIPIHYVLQEYESCGCF